MGEAGGQILAQPVAVRPAALGEALTAEGGSTDALPANPAALAGLAYPEGSALFHAGFAGDTFVAAAGGGNVKGFGVGGLVAYQTAGSVERLDPAGRPSQVSAQTDLRALLGIARGLPLVPVAAGASVEVIRSTLLEEFAATDVAGNLGLRTEIPGTALALGAAVTHWGGHLRYDDESLPIDHNALPFAYRFGLRWIALAHPVDTTIGTLESLRRPALRRPPPPHAVRLYADTVLRREERAVEYAGGAEYAWRDMVFLRGGFRRLAEGAARTRNLYALGAGIARGPVRIDYAIEMLEFTALHRVGLRVAGREEPEGRWAR